MGRPRSDREEIESRLIGDESQGRRSTWHYAELSFFPKYPLLHRANAALVELFRLAAVFRDPSAGDRYAD